LGFCMIDVTGRIIKILVDKEKNQGIIQ